MAFLIGTGVGYLLGVKGFGQKAQELQSRVSQQENFRPGSSGQAPQQGGQQPLNQGEAPPGAPGGRNPAPNQNGSGPVPNSPGQGQPLPQSRY